MKNYYIALMLLLLSPHMAHSQENRSKIYIDFRVNSAVIDTSYSGNAIRMQEALEFLQNIHQDSTIVITEVRFSGSASPEGSDQINRKLAQARLTAFERFVRARVDIPDSIINRDISHIQWDYLKSQIENSEIKHKQEILTILDQDPNLVKHNGLDYHADDRILKLKKLDNGKVWQQINKQYFHRMRNASAVFITYKKKAEPVLEEPVTTVDVATNTDTIVHQTPDTMVVALDSTIQEKKSFYMSLKTNALYDLLAVPNLGAEFYLGGNMSISANWHYAWWNTRSWFWRTYGGEVSARLWLGKRAKEKPLTGHHIGIYGQVLTYDFMLGNKGYMSGYPRETLFDRPAWAVGLEYGYSLPIAKRLNLDFVIGVGYLGGIRNEYQLIDNCYVWQSEDDKGFIGPTKAEVTLVWLLGKDNKNKGKGGNK